jgi:hypothetical protein
MKQLPKKRTTIFVLDENRMAKLDELISELQCIYCDILSNRGLSITSGAISSTPISTLLNHVSENGLSLGDVLPE